MLLASFGIHPGQSLNIIVPCAPTSIPQGYTTSPLHAPSPHIYKDNLWRGPPVVRICLLSLLLPDYVIITRPRVKGCYWCSGSSSA